MNVSQFGDVKAWAIEQWGKTQLGDERRTKRAIEVGAAMASNPTASLPNIMQGWNETRATYRLLAQEDVTHTQLLKPHIVATRALAENSQAPVVLFIQDTSELDYTKRKDIKGLGHIGDGKGRGMMLHSCLAVVPVPGNPKILGLAGQIPWLRGGENSNLEIEKIDPELLRNESEGEIWSQMVESIGLAPESGSTWISVGDRGSDIFSYLQHSQEINWQCLLRVTQNRVITKPDGTKGYLKTFARALEPMATKTMLLRGRNGEPKREVNLLVAWSAVCVQPPAGSQPKQEPIAGWCIRAWEPDGLIEEYHKCLKTGCAVEKRQLESTKSLVTLLGFLAVVAVRLLQLRGISRTHPQLPADYFVPPIMLQILLARFSLSSHNLTIGEFWKNVARLGGFLGRNSDGLPGWQTLWRGWNRLMDMCWAVDFTTQSLEKCW